MIVVTLRNLNQTFIKKRLNGRPIRETMPVSGSLPLGGDEDETKEQTMSTDYVADLLEEAKASGETQTIKLEASVETLNLIATEAARSTAERAAKRSKKFGKVIGNILDNSKDYLAGDRYGYGDDVEGITASEMRVLLGGDAWDAIEEEVKENLREEIEDEVRDEVIDDLDIDDLPDAVREAIEEGVKEQVINDAVRAIENL